MAFLSGVKKRAVFYSAFLLLGVSDIASASSSVTIGGVTTTCDNSCVVTNLGGGNYSISDCCGGQIHTRYRTPGTPEQN
ncbi:hypothetical protein GGR66_000110 [Xanthomonas sp. 3498]|nr:hypothetical protein [Xanthomonas sp. 3498]